MRFRTTSAAQTRAVAAALEPLLEPGDVLLLSGDLGAGKTVFTQGLAAALGVSAQVTSPTFTLAQSFEGRLRLHHLDVYRLENLGEVLDLDLPELLDDEAVVCVEWGEVVISELPQDFLHLRIRLADPSEGGDARVFDVELVGHRWQDRALAVETACLHGVEAAPC